VSVGPVERDGRSAPFFDGTAAGAFLLRSYAACGAVSEPQALLRQACGSADLGWLPTGGGAAVVNWTVIHSKPSEDGTSDRMVLVIAELDEGPWWWSQVVDVDPQAMSEGMRLRLDFERADADREARPRVPPA
jgi:uncharacterized OB-fold protein